MGQPSVSELTMYMKECRKQYAHHSAVISRKANNGCVVPVGKHSNRSIISSNYPNIPTLIIAHLLSHIPVKLARQEIIYILELKKLRFKQLPESTALQNTLNS